MEKFTYRELMKAMIKRNLTATSYKTMLFMMTADKDSYTQAMLANLLGYDRCRQAMTKTIRQLEYYGFLEEDRVEGSNRFLKISDKWQEFEVINPDQLKFEINE